MTQSAGSDLQESFPGSIPEVTADLEFGVVLRSGGYVNVVVMHIHTFIFLGSSLCNYTDFVLGFECYLNTTSSIVCEKGEHILDITHFTFNQA